MFLCPKCRNGKPKLSVNLETDWYNCWTCIDGRTKGRTLTGLLIGRVSQEELDEYLDSLDDGRSTRCTQVIVDDRRPVLPPEFQSVTCLDTSTESGRYLNYLERRGCSLEDAAFHRLGVCRTGDYSGRIVFPSFDLQGELDFFTSRKISEYAPGPSYVTCDTSKDIIFNECLIDWSRPIVLVEGPFDMLTVGRNAIPLQGKILRTSSKLFGALVRKAIRVYVCLDSDARYDQIAIAHSLYRYCVETMVVDVGPFKDVSEMGRERTFLKLSEARPYDAMNRVRMLCESST